MMSKVGPDGAIRYRPDGKVLKGPNYHAPEPEIKAILARQRRKP